MLGVQSLHGLGFVRYVGDNGAMSRELEILVMVAYLLKKACKQAQYRVSDPKQIQRPPERRANRLNEYA